MRNGFTSPEIPKISHCPYYPEQAYKDHDYEYHFNVRALSWTLPPAVYSLLPRVKLPVAACCPRILTVLINLTVAVIVQTIAAYILACRGYVSLALAPLAVNTFLGSLPAYSNV